MVSYTKHVALKANFRFHDFYMRGIVKGIIAYGLLLGVTYAGTGSKLYTGGMLVYLFSWGTAFVCIGRFYKDGSS